MKIQWYKTEQTAHIVLEGRFDFGCHRQFSGVCDDALAEPGVAELRIDFDAVDYLDSSALGMLLLARERASARRRAVSFANCRGLVSDVLQVANFGKLFKIH